MEEPGRQIVALYRSPSRQRCTEFAFVLRAVGIRSEVLPADEGGFVLAADARDEAGAREQLQLYMQEQRESAAPLASRAGIHNGLISAAIYGIIVLFTDLLARNGSFSLDWWQAGMNSSALIREGEWWRPVTSLTLHADTMHLAGNLIFGLFFGFFTGEALGWGIALAGMVFAGAIGNALNAFMHTPGHISVGASTAVFAAVGILAAYGWKRRQGLIKRWVPLGGGIALLAFLGMGGERTDVAAHFAGFAAGVLFGAIIAVAGGRELFAGWRQHVPGAAAVLLVILAWTVALEVAQ